MFCNDAEIKEGKNSVLPRKNRLKTGDFKKIWQRGKSLRGKFVFIKYLYSPNGFKLAVIINKKVAPKAVDRNKFKRRIKYIIKKYQQQIAKNQLLVVIATNKVAGAKFQELEQDLLFLLKQLNEKYY